METVGLCEGERKRKECKIVYRLNLFSLLLFKYNARRHAVMHVMQNAYLNTTHVFYLSFGIKLALEYRYIQAFYACSDILLYLPFSNLYVHNTC